MTRRHNPHDARARHGRTVLRVPSIAAAAATLLAVTLWLPAQDPPAAAPAATPEVPATPPAVPDAATLLAQSRAKLGEYRTLKAQLAETIDFGPARRFKASGVYLQGAGNKVALDLTILVGKNKGRLRQISEGDVLWNVYETGETPKITRRDLKQILAVAKGAEAKSTWLAELGLGGLPALLASIEGAIDLQPTTAAVIEGRSFYVLEGTWKPAIRQQFEAQLQQSPSPPNGPKMLPVHIPEYVRLYFDAETLFPYRIRYLKESGAPGVEPRPLLTLDFKDIVVNGSIDAEEFRYTPPEGAQVADTTKQYLDQFQAAQAPAAPAQPAPVQPAPTQPAPAAK